jgi:hypothetical protein
VNVAVSPAHTFMSAGGVPYPENVSSELYQVRGGRRSRRKSRKSRRLTRRR